MQVINSGDSSKVKPAPWWVGVLTTCDYCGFSATLEESDKPTHNGYTVSIQCPTCSSYLCELRALQWTEPKGWRRYPECKPEQPGDYLVRGFHVIHGTATYIVKWDNSGEWPYDRRVVNIQAITHWRPLPAPPKE